MKGQVTIEELISISAYLVIISILASATLQLKEGGTQWSEKVSLKTNADSLAITADAFCNSNLYNPYPKGKGTGYIEITEGSNYATAPALCGFWRQNGGEPI